MTDRFETAEERAFYLSSLLHMACDIVEDDTEIDDATRSELTLGLKLAVIAALRWRASTSKEPLTAKDRH